MASGHESGKRPGTQVRTVADLDHAVRSLSRHFRTDTVVIVGSQSVLVGWPDAPVLMRTSGEIDAYPANARVWEQANPGEEASEEVAALFGQDSIFHESFHFYIDGVDDRTAKLPPGWQARAVFHEVKDGDVTLLAIAPCTEDMVVAKLYRLVEKDQSYIAACHEARPLDIGLIKQRLAECGHDKALEERACRFLDSLPPKTPKPRPSPNVIVPPYPEKTHAAFLTDDGKGIVIREWDEQLKLYTKVGNTLGPAVLTPEGMAYMIGGQKMDMATWSNHTKVVAVTNLPAVDLSGLNAATGQNPPKPK